MEMEDEEENEIDPHYIVTGLHLVGREEGVIVGEGDAMMISMLVDCLHREIFRRRAVVADTPAKMTTEDDVLDQEVLYDHLRDAF